MDRRGFLSLCAGGLVGAAVPCLHPRREREAPGRPPPHDAPLGECKGLRYWITTNRNVSGAPLTRAKWDAFLREVMARNADPQQDWAVYPSG